MSSMQFDNADDFMEALEGIDINSDYYEENLEKIKNSLQQLEPFDPVPILTALFKRLNEDKKTIDHVHTMISFGLMRGFGDKKTWESIYSRLTSEDGRKCLQTAVDFLSVKIGRQDSVDTLTVPRLMQSFPTLTWKHHCVMVRMGTWSYVDKAKNAGYIGDLPMCLRYSGSPGVMGPDVWDTYRDEYCSFAQALGRMWKTEQTSEEIIRFAELNYECLAIEPQDRITMAMVKEAEAEIEQAVEAREAEMRNLQEVLYEMMSNVHFDTESVRKMSEILAQIPQDDDEDEDETKKQVEDEKKEAEEIEVENDTKKQVEDEKKEAEEIGSL